MTVREYIGARYVPLFMGDWDIDADYEPLSIVQYQGNSYTSRQSVPHGVEITNTAYWAVTGNYNAQVEAYRQEVLQYNSRIAATENALPIADFGPENTVAKAIEDTLAKLPAASFDSENTVASALAEKAFAFDTVTDMKAAENLFAGAICHTNGFKTAGDGGAAWYEISNTGTANEMDVIACGELYAHLIVTKPYICPEVIGSPCDGTREDTVYLQYLLDNYNLPIKLDGEYVSGQLNVTENYEIFGSGTVNLIDSDFCFIMIPSNSTINRIRVSGIKLKGSLDFTNFESRQYNAVFHNLSGSVIKNVIYDGITIENCAFGIYLNATEGGTFENAIVKNCTFNNMVGKDDASVSGNGLGIAVGTGFTQAGNVQIVNNHFNLTGRHAIYISNGYGVVCTGNVISNHRNNAYYVDSPYPVAMAISRCNDCVVSKNVIDHCKAPAFLINNEGNRGESRNIIYNDNVVYEHLYVTFGQVGTESPDVTGVTDNVEIGGNIFYEGNVEASYFIEFASGKNVKVHDNIFQKKTATNYSRIFDIHMFGDTAYSDNLSICDNIGIALGSPCYFVSFGSAAATSTDMRIDILNNMMAPNMTVQQGTTVSSKIFVNMGMGQIDYQSTLSSSASLADVIAKINAIIEDMRAKKMMNS